MPGLDRLTGGKSAVDSVSCSGPGDCVVGGRYEDRSGRTQVFIADERDGVWEQAQPLPGLAGLNKGDQAMLTQVSCASPGYCAAGGWYRDDRQGRQAWVATQSGGRWHEAMEVPGTAALNSASNAAVTTVSCATAGCVAGGWYAGGTRPYARTAFLVTEWHGTWRRAFPAPGLAALHTRDALVTAVSCAPSGWCSAVGDYTPRRADAETRMFAVSQR